jgi:hypothetical protein
MHSITANADDRRRKPQEDRERLRSLEMRVWSLDFHSSEEEIAEVLRALTSERFNNGDWSYVTTTLSVNYAIQLLNLKQQQKLVQEQRRGSDELVTSTKWLAYATIALAVITAIIGLAPMWSNK